MIIEVNGVRREVSADRKDERLIDYLRLDLGLYGTKNGCGIGACGACTVLLDGGARRACVTPLRLAHGKSVLTVEGLSGPGGALHPVQQAFIDAGAVQCGFCTPGMLLTAAALLNRHPEPTDDQIVAAFKGNLCRCTGYVQIFQAVRTASVRMLRDQSADSSK
jgi:carbon-monoxide dehydrogenase small subunit